MVPRGWFHSIGAIAGILGSWQTGIADISGPAHFSGLGYPRGFCSSLSRDGAVAVGVIRGESGSPPELEGRPIRWRLGTTELGTRPEWAWYDPFRWCDPIVVPPRDDGTIFLTVYQPCHNGSTSVPQAVPATWVGGQFLRFAAQVPCRNARVQDVSVDGHYMVGASEEGIYVPLLWIDGAMISLQEFSGQSSLGNLVPRAIRTPGPTIFGVLGEQVVRWSPQDGLQVIPLPAGSTAPRVQGVSDDGSVLIGNADDGSQYRLRGFIWRSGMGSEWVPPLASGDWLTVEAPSGDGMTYSASAWRATSATPPWPERLPGSYICGHGSPPVLVEELLDAAGLNTRGWQNLGVLAFSFDGHVLCGNGVNPCGIGEGWVAALGPAPTCVGDFNGSGVVSVQDLFDFLELFFAGNRRADWNGSCDITVQDIFDYLAAYFAGCP